MSTKYTDLMEQVYDAKLALRLLKAMPDIDSTKIAVMGYSWGGLAGAVLSDHTTEFTCLVSLDGSEFHHYGLEKEGDLDFDSTRSTVQFRNLQISVPYLRLESSTPVSDLKEDSVYNFREKLSGSNKIFKIDSCLHQDFGSLPSIVAQSGNCTSPPPFATITKLTIGFLEDHLKGEKKFEAIVRGELEKSIKRR